MILYCAEKATRMALDAIQCLGKKFLFILCTRFKCCVAEMWVLLLKGGNGYINDYPTGRFLRDAKLYEIGAGTSEIRRMLIGREFNKMFLSNKK